MILTFLLHAFYSAALADILANVFGGLNIWIVSVSLILGTYMASRHARLFKASHPEFTWNFFAQGTQGTAEIVLFTFILYAGVRHFVWMLYPSNFGLFTLSMNNFGDLPLHINYIRSLANGISFPPHNPSFASQVLHYPFGPDLYNAMWEVLGIRLPAHLAIVGIACLCASLIFLRAFAGWWGMGAFFLNGGLAGWTLLTGQLNPTKEVDWKNLLTSVFVTQRGMLFAIPSGLFLLCTIQKHFSREKELTREQMTVVGLVWAILPLFHIHTFVAVSLMMLGFALAGRGWSGAKDFFTSRMALIAYIPATFQVLASTDFLRKASIISWHPGWTANGNYLRFFVINFGPWLALPVILFLILYRSRPSKRALWTEFSVNIGLLLLFFNVMLAPWPWDNIKVLIWPYLGLARMAWLLIDPQIEKYGAGFTRGAVAFILFFSGFTVVLGSVQTPASVGVQIYHTSELANAAGALSGIPLTSVFAAATTHDHVLTYYGAMRVEGYEGHIWSHGIDGREVNKKLKGLMAGETNWRSYARDLGAQYIYWGPQERALYGDNPKIWMSELKNVSRVPDHAIYEIK